MRARLVLLASPVIILAGCASTAGGHDWNKVRLTTDREVVRGCEFLANVRDDSVNGLQSVETEMQKQTLKLGGNVLYETRAQEIRSGLGTKSSGAGEAYRCPKRP